MTAIYEKIPAGWADPTNISNMGTFLAEERIIVWTGVTGDVSYELAATNAATPDGAAVTGDGAIVKIVGDTANTSVPDDLGDGILSMDIGGARPDRRR